MKTQFTKTLKSHENKVKRPAVTIIEIENEDIKIKQRDIYTEIVEPSVRRQPGEGVKKEKDISQ